MGIVFPYRGEDIADIWMALNFVRPACLGESNGAHNWRLETIVGMTSDVRHEGEISLPFLVSRYTDERG